MVFYITWTSIETKIIYCPIQVVTMANIAKMRIADFMAVNDANTFRILNTI